MVITKLPAIVTTARRSMSRITSLVVARTDVPIGSERRPFLREEPARREGGADAIEADGQGGATL